MSARPVSRSAAAFSTPSLLPAYIRKPNGEPAFKGRSFAALDMRAGTSEASAGAAPVPSSASGSGGAAPVAQSPSLPRFTEFALQASPPATAAGSAQERPHERREGSLAGARQTLRCAVAA